MDETPHYTKHHYGLLYLPAIREPEQNMHIIGFPPGFFDKSQLKSQILSTWVLLIGLPPE